MEMNLDNIMEEVKVYDICEEVESMSVKQKNKKNNTDEKNNTKVQRKSDKIIKTNGIKNEYRNSIAKNIALMGITAVCAYFELMSPILYIPIEIACICVVSFKCGEWKGSVANG